MPSTEAGERLAALEAQMGRLVSDREAEKRTLASVHAELSRRLAHLEEVLDGNGRPGLKTTMVLTSERLNQLAGLVEQHVKASHSEVEGLKKLAWKFVGGLGAAQVVVLPVVWLLLQKVLK